MLNVLGNVKTIIDPDHFILHWIDLYEKHVSAATSEQEALEFLKTHHVTHLLLKEHSEAFLPVYPEQDSASAKVKIWKIHYPSDIRDNPTYLTKSPKN